MNHLINRFEELKQDGLLFLAQNKFEKAGDDAWKKDEAANEVARVLSLVKSSVIIEDAIKRIAKQYDIKAKDLHAKLKKAHEEGLKNEGFKTVTVGGEEGDALARLPKSVSKDEVLRWGFYGIESGEKTGYYFRQSAEGGDFKQVSNFIMTPLFHKYDIDDNSRIVKISNGIEDPIIVELPSEAMISNDLFAKFIYAQGPYFWDGSKIQLSKLVKRSLREFPKTFELKTLGWQPEGFFSYYNYAYNGELVLFNEVGIVKQDQKYFFSPAAADIYKDYRKEDDMFENDRYLEYSEPPINFEGWAKLMMQVYGEHSMAGIAFVMVSAFRDVVFKVDNNCPFLYAYGQSKSGKSKFAESITNLFFKEMPAFNLNAGTDFAFASRLARFRNCPVFFNEFDDNVVKDEWFQSLKGAYDGEGRERGKGGSKRKTETQKVNCTLVLVGQYLSTKDDNSVLSRSIMRAFQIQYDRNAKQLKAYDELKDLEKKGLGGIVLELMRHRKEIEKNYYQTFSQVLKDLSTMIREHGEKIQDRAVRNYAALATMVKIFSKKVNLPFTFDEYLVWCRDEVIAISEMISSNDILEDFWTVVETMVDAGIVQSGIHYKIEDKIEVRVNTGKDQTKSHVFGEARKVLYMRLSNVHKLYQKEKSKERGMAIDKVSLETYIKSREYFIGVVHSERIEGRTVTAWAFDFEQLGKQLEPVYRKPAPSPDQSESNQGRSDDDMPF